MNEELQRALQMLIDLFTELPPMAFVAAVVVLLAIGLWASHATWRSYRILDALTGPLKPP